MTVEADGVVVPDLATFVPRRQVATRRLGPEGAATIFAGGVNRRSPSRKSQSSKVPQGRRVLYGSAPPTVSLRSPCAVPSRGASRLK